MYYKFSNDKLFIEANTCTHIVRMSIELVIRFVIFSDFLPNAMTKEEKYEMKENSAGVRMKLM
jgi:hypothetical protein